MATHDPQTRHAVPRSSGLIRRNDVPRLWRGMRGHARTLLGIGMTVLAGCAQTNHYLIHPREPAPEVIVWSADFARDQIQVHIEGARPPGAGPFPTVLVHPEEDQTAADMHGVIWDLAARGYVAIAADYRRWIEGKYRRNYFAWRTSADVTLAIDVTRAYPEADQNRFGALGFGDTTKLLIVPGGERLFNFRQPQQATLAWDATLEWLNQYLRPTPSGAEEPRLGTG